MAEALYEKGELREARSLCQSALADMESGEHFYPAVVSAARTLSGIVLLQDGLGAGMRVIDSLTRMAWRRRLSEVERFLDLRRAELQAQAGEFSRLHAETVGQAKTRSASYSEDCPQTWFELDYRALLNARLMLQDGETEQAISLLRELDRECQSHGRTRTRVSVLVLTAAAHHKARRRY